MCSSLTIAMWSRWRSRLSYGPWWARCTSWQPCSGCWRGGTRLRPPSHWSSSEPGGGTEPLHRPSTGCRLRPQDRLRRGRRGRDRGVRGPHQGLAHTSYRAHRVAAPRGRAHGTRARARCLRGPWRRWYAGGQRSDGSALQSWPPTRLSCRSAPDGPVGDRRDQAVPVRQAYLAVDHPRQGARGTGPARLPLTRRASRPPGIAGPPYGSQRRRLRPLDRRAR
jgi:hypothetical protein